MPRLRAGILHTTKRHGVPIEWPSELQTVGAGSQRQIDDRQRRRCITVERGPGIRFIPAAYTGFAYSARPVARAIFALSALWRFSALGINLKTVVLKILCNAGWTDAAGKFIAQAVLVDLNLDTGLVGPHFENDPEALNAGGPMSVCGLLFEPAGLDDGSSLILHPASDFAGKATGFHLASQSLSTYKQQLKQWASRQETLTLVTLCYRNANAVPVERAAA